MEMTSQWCRSRKRAGSGDPGRSDLGTCASFKVEVASMVGLARSGAVLGPGVVEPGDEVLDRADLGDAFVDGTLVVAGEEVTAVDWGAARTGAGGVVDGRVEVGDGVLLPTVRGRLADIEVVDLVSGLQNA